MAKALHPGLIIRLYREEKCFGPGVARLLELVEKGGSLRSAAAAMDMAYSKAWTILKRAERELGFPLTCGSAGGKGGGSTALTEDAEALLRLYRRYSGEVNAYAEERFRALFGAYLPEESAE